MSENTNISPHIDILQVKLHIGDSEPESYAPILVQSMMKKVVEANGNRRAIVSCDGKIDWNYDQYYQEVQKAAKGFISLGKDFLYVTFFQKIFSHCHFYR